MPSPEEAIGGTGLPDRLTAPVGAYLRGELPANVALMRLMMEAATLEEAERALASAAAAPGLSADAGARLSALARLSRRHPQAWATVRRVLAEVAHDLPAAADARESLARIAAAFDGAARASPDGSAALYALGDPDLLARATAEIVADLGAAGLLGSSRIALDLGCGSGRVTAALAPGIGAVLGIDVSGEMLRAARRRCGRAANVLLARTSGRDLACLPDRAFDLVLAVDCFPYLVQAGGGLAAKHVAEGARVLASGGDLVILNYSYRGDPEADRAEVAALAAEHAFALLRAGERPFSLWDGAAFQLRKVG